MISWRKHYKRGLIAIGLLLSTSASIYAQGDAKNGEKLFKADCAACHALDKQLVGPALGGVVDRLKTEQNLDTDWLHKWIKDNKSLRASGDKYANEVFEKFNQTEMLAFPNLTDQEIDDILEYTTNPPAPEPVATAAGEGAVDANSVTALEAQKMQSMNSKIILLSLLSIGGLLVWLLLKLKQLVKLQQADELTGLNASKAVSFADMYRKYHYVGKGILVVLGVFAAYGLWNMLMWVGVYKGYKPEQPIYFSHKIHAGENKIGCQLCHSSAKYGKVSEIP
ncbi:c-type cytochrome, partial [Kaistella sp.]|uniref:c-type cytochrome n=1 Tax=Kaistella sp. TaxID=2782235 RepID=UPI0035A0A1CF